MTSQFEQLRPPPPPPPRPPPLHVFWQCQSAVCFQNRKGCERDSKVSCRAHDLVKFYSGKSLKGQLTPVSRQHVIEPYTEKRTCVVTSNAFCNEREQLQLVVFWCTKIFWLVSFFQTVYRTVVSPSSALRYPITYQKMGWDSSLRVGLFGDRIPRDFPHPPRPALGPTEPPIQWVSGLSRGKAARTCRWPSTPNQCRC